MTQYVISVDGQQGILIELPEKPSIGEAIALEQKIYRINDILHYKGIVKALHGYIFLLCRVELTTLHINNLGDL